MLPTVALVGRPNVGKSTLFNRLTRTRDALVADYPGLTRDRQYGRARAGEQAFLVVDTGGFEPEAKTGIMKAMARQTEAAISESDVVVFLVDAREGLVEQDREIAAMLRKTGRPVIIAANKSEGLPPERALAEFHALGFAEMVPISAAHGEGVRALVEDALGRAPAFGGAAPAQAGSESGAPELNSVSGELRSEAPDSGAADPADSDLADAAADAETGTAAARVKVAIVGRPNVGKSTLVNALAGEERVIAFDEPGTTRDAIHLDFDRDGKSYTLIDTAGVRRRGKVFESIEKFSIIKTLQAIEDANVVVLLLDAPSGITEQDAHIAAHILEAGRALVVGVNKWDAVPADERDEVKRELSRKLAFLGFADMHFIAAKEGRGIGALMRSVDDAFRAAMAKLSTPRLTRALQQAVERQQPPRAGLVRPKLRYAHQGGSNPPVVVIHGTALAHVPDAYRRYLEHFFADAFQIRGTPLRIQFKSGVNPYANASRRRG